MARPKLGEILVQRGVLDDATLKRALGEQIRFASQKMKLGQILVDMRACTWEQVCEALSEQLNFPFADLTLLPVSDDAVKLVPVEVCEKWKAIAFHREPGPPEQVDVAFADPADVVAVDAMRLRLGKRLRVHLGAPSRIQEVIDRVFRGVMPSAAVEMGDDLFGSDAPLAIEHYEAGSLQVPEFDPSAPITSAADGASISLDNDFDSVFGRPTTPPPPSPLHADASSAAGLGDVFAGLGLGGPAVVPEMPEPEPEPLTPRAEILHFPDRRPKEAPAPAPVATPATKPTLVLTSDALFGPAPEPAVADNPESKPPEPDLMGELTGEVLPGEEVVDDGLVGEVDPSQLDSSPADHDLFGAGFDAGEHHDPLIPTHAPEPGGAALFGTSFHADQASSEGIEPLPELAMPPPPIAEIAEPPTQEPPLVVPVSLSEPDVVDDADLEELIPEPPTQEPPAAALASLPSVAAPPTIPTPVVAPAAEQPELGNIFDDVPSEPAAGSAPLSAKTISPPTAIDLPPLPDLFASEPAAGAVPPPPAAPKVATSPKLEVPKPVAKPLTPAPVPRPTPVPVTKPDLAKVTSSPKLEAAKPEPLPLPKPAEPKLEAVKVEPPKPVTAPKLEAAKPEPEAPKPAPKLELAKPAPTPAPKPLPKVDGTVPPSAEKWTVVSKARVDGQNADSKPDDADLASFADRPLTPEELEVIEAIEALADGLVDEPTVKQTKPAHMIAALVRLLIRRGVIHETDFLEELTRK